MKWLLVGIFSVVMFGCGVESVLEFKLTDE